MHKDFDGWSGVKKDINAKKSAPFCHEREVWWCTLGVNVGSEQDGSSTEYRRPVLILKGFSRETFLVIPLTTSVRAHPLRPSIGMIAGKESHALLSQMRVIDTKRLVRKIAVLDTQMFEIIRKTARGLL
jgi:mRNA-degrading endonuclease toxin of MazEF toxin-antitoxin module